MRTTTKALMVVLGLVLQAGNLTASAFTVTPVRVTFSGPSSTLLTLKNESTQPLRFQVASFAWSQDPSGQMQLAPTEDIVFFPALLSLNPGQERKVRVAAKVAAADSERSYRIFFEELPALQRPNDTGAQVRILTKMGIPIFVVPANVRPAASIESIRLEQGAVAFDVRNNGNVHFGLQSVKLHGTGSKGEPVFEQQLDGWYVLPGSPRSYRVEVPAASCSQLKKIVIEAQTDVTSLGTGGSIARDFEVLPGSCK